MIFRAPKWAQSVLRSECGTGTKQVKGLFTRHLSVAAIAALLFLALPQEAWGEIKRDTLNFSTSTSGTYGVGVHVPNTLSADNNKKGKVDEIDAFLYSNYGIHFSSSKYNSTNTTSLLSSGLAAHRLLLQQPHQPLI